MSDETAARPATKATVSQDERLTLVELAREAVEARARQRERLPLGGRGNTPRLVALNSAWTSRPIQMKELGKKTQRGRR